MAARLVRPNPALLVVLLVTAALAALAAVKAPPASALTNQSYIYISSIGPPAYSFGTNGPWGVAVDAAGNVYVGLSAGIAKFYANGSLASTYTGTGSYTMTGAWGLDVNDSGSIIYVAEHDMNRIAMVRLDQYGFYNLVSLIGKNDGDGSSGWGNGEFNGPEDVAVDGNYLYVADSNLDRIQKFSIDTSNNTLTWVDTWGTYGSGNAAFAPAGIAADHAGHLFVTDFDNHHVQELSTTDGAFITAWGVSTPTYDPLYMMRVRGIDVDAQGNVYTTDDDSTTCWVDKFKPGQGGYYWQMTWFGGPGTADNQFQYPFAVAVAPNGYVYVTDSTTHKLKKFARDATPPVVNISGVTAGWTNHDVNVVLTAYDPIVDGQWTSGFLEIFYRLNNDAFWWGGSYTSPWTKVIDTEGDTLFNYAANDVVNNWSSTTNTAVHVRIDKSAPATAVSGVPAGWSKTPVTATFGPSDALSGVASTEYSTNGGTTWTPGSSATISSQGTTTLLYRSADVAGNVEAANTATVRIDSAPPTTTVSGVPTGWSKTAVSASFAATDALSGVAKTEYSTDGGSTWTAGSGATISAQGTTTLRYRSTDAAGNIETTQTVAVRVDALGPQTLALAKVSVKKGKSATFRFRINDLTPTATVTIKIYKGKVLKKTVTVGSKPTGSAQSYKWRCKLARGRYTWKVYAKDLAGNVQSRIGSKTLTVK